MTLPDPIAVEDMQGPAARWNDRTRLVRLDLADPDLTTTPTPVRITARDGWVLPSYLTLPSGIEPFELPMVLMVRGNGWGLDENVRSFADRGHAVLQVDFRGSAVSSRAHVEAALGDVAGAMHEDLVDAADWAVEQGYADPDRVSVFGGSYSGYATLVGVMFTPDRSVAAIEYVGISDLADAARGVRARGLEVEYLAFPAEGTMLVDPQNLIAAFRTARRFLSRHLGGRRPISAAACGRPAS